MAEPTPRMLLPHVSQPPGSASNNSERREPPRSYVFVDEQNRHRRLKVVRACDGCRKKKIRCDSANTNNWPCAACVRLKMTCVPPTLGYDGDDAVEQDYFTPTSLTTRYVPERYENTAQYNYGPPQYGVIDPYRTPLPPQQHTHSLPASQNTSPQSPNVPTAPVLSKYAASRYNPPDNTLVGVNNTHNPHSSHNYTLASNHSTTKDETSNRPDADSLINGFVGLNIGNDAVASYIRKPKNAAPDQDVPDEEPVLPQHIGSNSRIPPEWMPSDNQATQYFVYFFEHIHPYIPVLTAPQFYRLWDSDRHSISPLILEAIFACSALAMGHATEGNRWLALAARHEENFKDSPRLSTIQGMLLLLKAREAVPKRGYYYRSWMTIVNLIAMAKDLELDQHFELHQQGQACDAATPEECSTMTRVWQVLFAIELLVGGPQGRTKYNVPIETVDFDGTHPLPGLEEREQQVTHNFTLYLQCVRSVRTSNLLYAKLGKGNTRPDWASDPEFVRHNSDFDHWIHSLPPHLRITYPPDGSPPWISFHFVANLHTYHHSCVLIHYRPQLELASKTMSPSWKPLMMQCLSASKNICQLQEGILNQIGLPGLFHILRGINFHIYAILTCINIHLVALTSPDPDVHYEAPDYFTRHMRLLEQFSASWLMPELQQQIDSLRQAFSADTSKSFELRASYVYGSPKRSDSLTPPPLTESQYSRGQGSIENGYGSFSIASPQANGIPASPDFGPGQPIMTMNGGQAQYDPNGQMMSASTGMAPWNPTPIFDQFNATFAIPQAPQEIQTPISQTMSSPTAPYISHHPNQDYQQYGQPVPHMQMPDYVSQLQSQPQQLPINPAFATSHQAMVWRDLMASTSIAGIKRSWQHPPARGPTNGITKRPRQ